MYNIEQIQNGVTRFIEQEIASKATGFKKFSIYFLMPTVKKTVTDYVHKFKTFMPELIDADDKVNLDLLYNYSKSAIQHSGQFEFMGIIFNETDIDKLYSYIKNI